MLWQSLTGQWVTCWGTSRLRVDCNVLWPVSSANYFELLRDRHLASFTTKCAVCFAPMCVHLSCVSNAAVLRLTWCEGRPSTTHAWSLCVACVLRGALFQPVTLRAATRMWPS